MTKEVKKLPCDLLAADAGVISMCWSVSLAAQIMAAWFIHQQPLAIYTAWVIILVVFLFFSIFGRFYYFEGILKCRKCKKTTKVMKVIRSLYVPISILNFLFFFLTKEKVVWDIILVATMMIAGNILLLKGRKEKVDW